MQLIIHQSFCIHTIKVGAITNSSVLQIGSTGSIQALAQLYNSGGFTEPAEELTAKEDNPDFLSHLVPLSPV